MTKAETENKKSIARSLYMAGQEQQEIAERLGVSRVTISKWCNTEGWKEARAAKNITRPELVNKLLLSIDNLIETVNKSEDPTLIGSLADKLSKLSAVVEKLDKKANVVDAIEVFMAFNKWIQDRASYDPGSIWIKWHPVLNCRHDSSREKASLRTVAGTLPPGTVAHRYFAAGQRKPDTEG